MESAPLPVIEYQRCTEILLRLRSRLTTVSLRYIAFLGKVLTAEMHDLMSLVIVKTMLEITIVASYAWGPIIVKRIMIVPHE